eukprot:8553320-Lingulodinium_polyedra.AAC.1
MRQSGRTRAAVLRAGVHDRRQERLAARRELAAEVAVLEPAHQHGVGLGASAHVKPLPPAEGGQPRQRRL